MVPPAHVHVRTCGPLHSQAPGSSSARRRCSSSQQCTAWPPQSVPHDAGAERTCSHCAMTRTFFKSTSKSSLRPGRCTLTTTRSPFSLARCTWPREAAAIGLKSNSSKISSTGLRNERSIVARTAPPPNGGTCNAAVGV